MEEDTEIYNKLVGEAEIAGKGNLGKLQVTTGLKNQTSSATQSVLKYKQEAKSPKRKRERKKKKSKV